MASRVPPALLAATERALGDMMEGFRRVDETQRIAKAMVDKFVAYLPERAGRSGLVPRFRVVDGQADELIGAYLSVLDRFPFAEDLEPQQMAAAQHAYKDVGPRLLAHADVMQQFMNDWDAELSRIGGVVQASRELREQARASLERALQAAVGLARAGHEVPEAAALVDEARAAGRAVAAWTPGSPTDELERHGARLAELADALEVIAAEWPERVERATRRRRSLSTKVQMIESRTQRVPDDLAALRREFSVGNWRDLDSVERDVEAGLVSVRERLVEYDRLVAAGAPWARPLELLEEVRGLLDDVEEVVDRPRERVEELRAVKADPEKLMSGVRFQLRDAQQLVANSRVNDTQSVARELDALAGQVDGLRGMLTGAHPDYLAMLRAARRVEDGVRRQVERYRELARR
ncbi:hypothetical protein [uncultured Nocardioides sp.]|uniref:hypothetical protein n=1 Tax=uncultured Nocardioides sp. TaxID=198441 RepID=UPI00260B67A1|nr:hypothetical protein [uncultured Nocardioides sp.]